MSLRKPREQLRSVVSDDDVCSYKEKQQVNITHNRWSVGKLLPDSEVQSSNRSSGQHFVIIYIAEWLILKLSTEFGFFSCQEY